MENGYRHETNSITIQNHRLDPLTSTTSAAISTGMGMVRATTDIFVKPYQEANRGRGEPSRPSLSRSISTPAPASRVVNENEPPPVPDINKVRNNWETTGAVAAASAKGFGRFLANYYKGVIVDIPLATTEGLRAVPRLYGEEVEEYNIRDWKSGAIAGGKNFATGMREGFTGVWTQPMQAADEGALGVAKGIMKGTVGLATKVPSGECLFAFLLFCEGVYLCVFLIAALGLVAYPAHGICKSIHTAVRSSTRKQIAEARLREGTHLVRSAMGREIDRKRVMILYDGWKKGEVVHKGEESR